MLLLLLLLLVVVVISGGFREKTVNLPKGFLRR
jgi:hypothetical protein